MKASVNKWKKMKKMAYYLEIMEVNTGKNL